MGKKRIHQLLEKLDTLHQADVHNAAAIYAVAQVAVNQLEAQTAVTTPNLAGVLPASAVVQWTKASLESQYGSFNRCRQVAKSRGIRFSKTPSWDQLVAAFNCFEALQELIQKHLATQPQPNLKGVKMEFPLG